MTPNPHGAVQLRPAGQCVEYSGMLGGLALIEEGKAPTLLNAAALPTAPPRFEAQHFEPEPTVQPWTPAPQAQRPTQAAEPTSPGGIVKAARERIKSIKTELRTHKALQRELAELERLVTAAKARPQKPTAHVRDITRRTAG